MERLVAVLGLLTLVAIAWACSAARRRFPWRTAVGGIALQLALGALVFHLPGARAAFAWLNDAVAAALGASLAGSRFLFGPLALPPGSAGSLGFVLATQVLPIAIVVSSLTALAYRLGLVQPLVRLGARLFHRTLGISGAEALSSSANLFVGVESALAVRPYLARMTASELLVLLTCGMATVASTALAVYAIALAPVFPAAAGHLIAASVIAIPGAVVIAKVLLPETGTPDTAGAIPPEPDEARPGVMEAVLGGAMEGLKLVAGIAACLIALLGLVAIADRLIAAIGGALGLARTPGLVDLASLPFYPLAALTGIAPADIPDAARILGQRVLETEFSAYLTLAQQAQAGAFADPRSVVVLAYALCGFAHVASVAIFVGGTAALVPERRADLARLGPRALLAATLATLTTGCIAGVFCSGTEVAF